MNREQLSAAYADAVAARSPGARPACPAPETILALVRREGSEDDRVATLNHVLSCADCEREFELLRAIEGAGSVARQGGTHHSRWRRYAGVALAASVVLAIALGPGRLLFDREQAVRGGADPLAPIAPAAGATLRAASSSLPTFAWHASPDVERYTLEVLTSDGVVAFSANTRDTTLDIPSARALAPGEYQWSVSARGSDGSELRSAARRLRVVR